VQVRWVVYLLRVALVQKQRRNGVKNGGCELASFFRHV
jgi:hypothetical protein